MVPRSQTLSGIEYPGHVVSEGMQLLRPLREVAYECGRMHDGWHKEASGGVASWLSAATAVSSYSPPPSLAARPGGLLTPATDPYPVGMYAHLVSFVMCWTMSGSQRESTSSYSTDTQ